MFLIRPCNSLLKNIASKSASVRSLSHYPIDDTLFGLTEDQQQVSYLITNTIISLLLFNKSRVFFSPIYSYVKQCSILHKKN